MHMPPPNINRPIRICCRSKRCRCSIDPREFGKSGKPAYLSDTVSLYHELLHGADRLGGTAHRRDAVRAATGEGTSSVRLTATITSTWITCPPGTTTRIWDGSYRSIRY